MNEGWVRLYRKFLDWEWFELSDMVKIFTYFLLKANYEDKKWKGIDVKRGQLITGRKQLSIDLKMSERKVRTCIERLKLTSEITIKSTNKYSIITINNYNSYNIKDDEERPTKRPTKDQQKTNKRPQLKKKKKNIKNNNKQIIFKKEQEFKKGLEEFSGKYSEKMLDEFSKYWTEPNKSKTKLRWELQPTWDTSRRLANWAKRNFTFRKDEKKITYSKKNLPDDYWKSKSKK